MKKILNHTKVYVVGAIQYDNNAREWRERATIELAKLGIIVFNPFEKPFVNSVPEDEMTKSFLLNKLADGDFETVRNHMKLIRAYDLRCVDLSDFIIANIDPQTASWGSADEIFTSLRMKKPVFLIVKGGVKKCPLWLLGSIPINFIYESLDDVIADLIKIDSGEKPIDCKYWKLLKPELR